MTRTTTLVLALALLVVPTFAHATGGIFETVRLVLRENDFVALRFNLSGDSDLALSGRVEFCDNKVDVPPDSGFVSVYPASLIDAKIGIRDGRVGTPGVFSSPGLAGLHAGAVGIPGQTYDPSTGTVCERAETNGGSTPGWARSQFTLIQFVRSPKVYYNVTLQATFGVTSYDVFLGHGSFLMAPEWNGGAFVGTAGVPGPAVGIATQETTFDHDAVSLFFEAADKAIGYKNYTCTQDSNACPAVVYGGELDGKLYVHQSDGATHTRHQLVEAALDRTNPSLVQIPLPDDDYVTGANPWTPEEMDTLCRQYCRP